MAVTRWTGRGGDQSWFDAKNWTAGVPADQQPVVFADGGTWDIGFSGPGSPIAGATRILGDSIAFRNGRVTFDAAQPKSGLGVDMTVGGGGSLTVGANAILVAGHAIDVGAVVAGSLTPGSLLVQGQVWTDDFALLDGNATVDAGGGISQLDGSLTVSVAGTLAVQNGGSIGGPAGAAETTDVTIGSFFADGTVLVSGAGSALRAQNISLGNGFSGKLVITDGARVDAAVVTAGESGDGTLEVSNGGVLAATADIGIGGTVPVVSDLAITNHGSVYAGSFGLILQEGRLTIDPSGVLFGSIVSDGGFLVAQPTPGSGHAPGTVTLGQPIALGSLAADPQFGNTTWLSAAGGTTLRITGQITDSTLTSILRIASGTVELANSTNTIGSVLVGNATLEVTHRGAAGAGPLAFLQGDTAADLVVATPSFSNPIEGFAAGDTIDLAGFAFARGVTHTFAQGVLTLSDGSRVMTLQFAGQYLNTDFVTAQDAQTGTRITFHHG